MTFYNERILPHLIGHVCSMGPIMELRQQIVPQASGVVLEVGIGSGINLAYYEPRKVEFVWGLEPSEGMRSKARANLSSSPVTVRWLDLPGEHIPLDDHSVDTVVLTYTLCAIPDWFRALKQMHRVLKPGGKLLFCEHGLSPDQSTSKWQHRITPGWKKIAGGCHLNRPISRLIEEGGFRIEKMDNLYIRNAPRIAGYMYYGVAIKPRSEAIRPGMFAASPGSAP